jgi:hypothetical protein
MREIASMRSAPLNRLAMAGGALLLCWEAASACTLPLPLPWFCESKAETVYAPMRAPAQDPRVGPVWTPNGWSYPEPVPDADAPPVWAREAPAARRAGEPVAPGLDRPLK